MHQVFAGRCALDYFAFGKIWSLLALGAVAKHGCYDWDEHILFFMVKFDHKINIIFIFVALHL